MAITSADELAQHALNQDLLSELQLQQVWGEFGSRNVTLDEFRQSLLRRDFLTFYQIEHLIAGDRTKFFYGDYKVLYLVGTGTFARVYRATHRHSHEQVAVKVLRKRFCDIKEEAERFCREGEMGTSLKHPNIVPIHEVYSKGHTHYIVIEFVEGQNLRDFLKVRKKFDPPEATRLVLDVLNGLDYAFQRGITHRDMKLSNVLVSSLGQAKLVDFGLAGADKNLSDETLVKHPNPRAIDYAGLERATGVHKNDPRSDIFFVGSMYYHMLTGKPPLVETRDRTQRLSRGRFRDITPVTQIDPTISDDLAIVVNKAMQFDPDRRYQSPGEMAADVQAIFEGVGLSAPESNDRPAAAPGAGPTRVSANREGLDASGQPRKLMLVEGDVNMQNMFRQRFKRNGYRVLVTSDPERAKSRFADEKDAADLVLFSTGAIGESVLEAFNEFGENPETRDIPAVLLLDERHRDWQSKAVVAEHRAVAPMPITLRQLRELLVRVSLAVAGVDRP